MSKINPPQGFFSANSLKYNSTPFPRPEKDTKKRRFATFAPGAGNQNPAAAGDGFSTEIHIRQFDIGGNCKRSHGPPQNFVTNRT